MLRAIPFMLIVIGYAAFEVQGLRQSQHLFEPLFTFDQFESMRRADERCGEADSAQREAFASNLETVRVQARAHLTETHPERSAEEIDRMLADRRRAREGEVDAQVEAGGCSDSAVWQWVKLHEQRSRLTIRTR